ncbi:MAG TPA: hypothetical protein VNN79_10460 [Actinomycetota bacterium]|nr:hypothetical protein [Actinomycetota bacterium]
MGRSIVLGVRGFAVAILLVGIVNAPALAAGSSATCESPGGQPRAGAGDAVANGVTVVSPCLAWFVGAISHPSGSEPLIERWNGTAWKTQSAPNPGNAMLADVVATSSSNAWAVGRRFVGSTIHPLIERWNGAAWKVQRLPNPDAKGALTGVTATSSSDAWAVGTANENTLIEHWNGSVWKVVPSPNPGTSRDLQGVDATSPSNAWAVGSAMTRAGLGPLILHWNGRKWLVQRNPDLGVGVSAVLFGVTATSSTNAWAVGLQNHGTGQDQLVLHWNGTAWKVQSSQSPPGLSELHGVVATSATSAWAVGFRERTGGAPDQTLMEHWNGTSWKIVSSPNPRATLDRLYAVDAESPHDVWGVGTYSNGSSLRPLAFERT